MSNGFLPISKEDTIKYKSLTSKLKLLPSFVGKSINEALSYCEQNNLKCEKNLTASGEIILTQSIEANSDLSTIRNKTIIFETENYVIDENQNEKDEIITDNNNNENLEQDDNENSNETTPDDNNKNDEEKEEVPNQETPIIPDTQPNEEIKKEDSNEEEKED